MYSILKYVILISTQYKIYKIYIIIYIIFIL